LLKLADAALRGRTHRNLPPAVEEETDEPGSEEEEDDEEEEEDREEEVGASTRGEEVDVYVAHTSGVVVRPDHAQPAPPRHIAAAIDHSAEGKGKEKETTGSVAVATTSTGTAAHFNARRHVCVLSLVIV
jgi:hypothetical protein